MRRMMVDTCEGVAMPSTSSEAAAISSSSCTRMCHMLGTKQVQV